MKLKNKQTGEIGTLIVDGAYKFVTNFAVEDDEMDRLGEYNSLAELNKEWEDYEEPKEYWFINSCGVVEVRTEEEQPAVADMHKQFGNYFGTKEEAELAVEKLKAWKRLKDNGISFEVKVIDGKWYLAPKAEPQQRTFDETHDVFKDIMFIFGGEE